MPDMELLAPAGNPSVALAAFDAGADAVYCGLHKFNARERSENFSHDELAKIVAYAHKSGRKVYVTFNTLLKESELQEAASELAHLAMIRPDALIVQDLGAARMIREYFPDLTLHASTQLGIHNSAGMKAAEEFGFKRVILERQVTLNELKELSKSPLELEVFVHGALCCCVSGSCLFSSWLGGWSGNRGKCKQPCRRQYFRDDDPDHKHGEFLFSPDDLAALDLLQDFRNSGIKSLKIEGRLRRADYVEKVVRAYRVMLDADSAHKETAWREAGDILRGVKTRKMSLGFYTKKSMQELVSLGTLGGSGMPCGEVESSVRGGFEAQMHGRLHVGDTIRVQSEADTSDGFNATVLYMEIGQRSVLKVQPGERCFIRTDKKARRGALIYRTGESGPDYTTRLAKLPMPKLSLDVKVCLNAKGIQAFAGDKMFAEEFTPAAAQKHAVSPEDLKREFSAAASEIYEAGEIQAEVNGTWFLPASELKNIRRKFWTWAETEIPRNYKKQRILAGLKHFRDEYLKPIEKRPDKFPDYTAPGNVFILPPFVPEGELSALQRKVNAMLAEGKHEFRLTNFFQFALFPKEQRSALTLRTMYPFPVSNSQAVQVCREFGAKGCQAWIELGQGDMPDMLAHSTLPLEAYVYGRPCIFTTRASLLPWKHFHDIKDNSFEMERSGALTQLYPDEVLSIACPDGFSAFRDLRHAAENETRTTEFNTSREWV